MICELVTTREGARAILDRETGEVMHPVVGPQVESRRLYLEPSRLVERLRDLPEGGPPLRLFDVGLGAGSNAIAAWHAAQAGKGRLEIVSFDRSRAALALALEHAADFALEGEAGLAARAIVDRGEHEGERVAWRYVEGELPGSLAVQGAADLVFWDPFSPRANGLLWTYGAFSALRAVCRAGCTVHTYGGATATRAALLLAGFFVGTGPAIGQDGKRGTIAATEIALLDAPLPPAWLDRLRRSSAPLPVDAPAEALSTIARHPQFNA